MIDILSLNTKERFESQTEDGIFVQVNFRRDSQNIEYRSQDYTVLESIAKIGGIFIIVSVVFEFILLFFIQSIFYTNMISRLYQLEDNHDRIYLTDTSDYDEDKNKSKQLIFYYNDLNLF